MNQVDQSGEENIIYTWVLLRWWRRAKHVRGDVLATNGQFETQNSSLYHIMCRVFRHEVVCWCTVGIVPGTCKHPLLPCVQSIHTLRKQRKG